MNIEKIFHTIWIISSVLFVFFLTGVITDALISTDDNWELDIVETIEVPCIDNNGNEFEDELCFKKITCSKLGLVGERRCK